MPLKASAQKFLEKRTEYNKSTRSLESKIGARGAKRQEYNGKISELVQKTNERLAMDRPYLISEKS